MSESKDPRKMSGKFNMDEFGKFIVSVLKRGKLIKSEIERLTTPQSLEEFKVAFTHPSAGAERDYQLHEFLGDVVINEFIPFYLHERFPSIVSVKWITRLKHTLVSGKILARIILEQGIEKWAIYGNEPFSNSIGKSTGMLDELKAHPDLKTNKHYLAMLEDIMEGFFGCLTLLITKPIDGTQGKPHGVATQVSHYILETFFNDTYIPNKYEEVFDPVSRLKELYESRARALKWKNDESIRYEKLDYKGNILTKNTQQKEGKTRIQTIIYGWPLGDKTCKPENKVELARAIDIDKADSKKKAAEMALEVLDKKYGIKDIPFDPNVKK